MCFNIHIPIYLTTEGAVCVGVGSFFPDLDSRHLSLTSTLSPSSSIYEHPHSLYLSESHQKHTSLGYRTDNHGRTPDQPATRTHLQHRRLLQHQRFTIHRRHLQIHPWSTLEQLQLLGTVSRDQGYLEP